MDTNLSDLYIAYVDLPNWAIRDMSSIPNQNPFEHIVGGDVLHRFQGVWYFNLKRVVWTSLEQAAREFPSIEFKKLPDQVKRNILNIQANNMVLAGPLHMYHGLVIYDGMQVTGV